MEPITLLYTFISILFLVLVAFKIFTRTSRKLPPSPFPSLPMIGHLHLIKPPMHRTFQKISEKLGPIFLLRFGTRLVVVVSSPSIAEECFTKNDIVLADRPEFIAGKYIGYNNTVLVSSSYSEHWRNLRRFTKVEIFSSARLNVFNAIRHDEVRLLLLKLYTKSEHEFSRVELRPMINELSFNIIMRMVAGKRYFGEVDNNEEANKFRQMIKQAFIHAEASNPADFFPALRWIDYKGFEKSLQRLSDKMDAFLQGLVDEKRRAKGENNTMIDHLLTLQESQPGYYTDIIIKGVIWVMLLAGTDTSAVTIEWAISALLNNPEKLEKARAEIESLVGNDRLVTESDLSNLPYLQNIISETFRMFPAFPLLLPHQSSDDCTIEGYDIPRGTMLLVNAWAIHRDPNIWDDPTTFKPERFELDGEFGPPKLMPFGMGRRSCPGIGLAQRVIGLALGSLIQCFEWQRLGEDNVDMKEGKGLSMPKAVPLEARCKARKILHKVQSGEN